MSDTHYGLEARMREVELLQEEVTTRAGREPHQPPPAPSRHRLAERLRRVADRLDS